MTSRSKKGTRKTSDAGFTELFIRHGVNPIIQAKDIPYQTDSVFNAGGNPRVRGDETLLLMRVENRRGFHILRRREARAESQTGFKKQSTGPQDVELAL